MKNLVNEINHLLVDRKMDRSTFAKALGMSRQNLSRILSENKVKGDMAAGTLEKIARTLNVPITHFFDDDVCGNDNAMPTTPRRTIPSDVPVQQFINGQLSLEKIIEDQLDHLKQMVEKEEMLMRIMLENRKPQGK